MSSNTEVTMTRFLRMVLVLSVVMFGIVIFSSAQQSNEETVTCAVSGEQMKKSEAKGSLEYEGNTYYFCCDHCQEAFEKDPEKYIDQESRLENTHMHQHGEEQMHEKSESRVVDPVCGMEVEKSEAAATYEYKGTTYYFCMEGCKEKFEKNPEQYIKK